jgi:hypothetical protein
MMGRTLQVSSCPQRRTALQSEMAGREALTQLALYPTSLKEI